MMGVFLSLFILHSYSSFQCQYNICSDDLGEIFMKQSINKLTSEIFVHKALN